MRKILVIGGSGLLGSGIMRATANVFETYGTYNNHPFKMRNCKTTQLNITKRKQVKNVIDNPDAVIRAYKGLSKQLGFNFIPSESFIDWMAKYCLEINETESAIKYFEMNIKNYTHSSAAFRSIADFYLNIDDKVRAEVFYKRAISIDST